MATAGRWWPRYLLRSETIFLWLILAYVCLIGLWPLCRLFAETFTGISGQPFALIGTVWKSRSLQHALLNTVTASTGATTLATIIGTSMALTIGLTNLPGKSFAVFIFLLPLLIPPQIIALAWSEFTGSNSLILSYLHVAPAPGSSNPLYSVYGVIFVMGLEHAVIVFMAVQAGLRNLPRDVIEAARLAGANPIHITRKIVLPILRPTILAGAALAFVSAIGNFGVPAVLGIPGRYPMLTTLIYQRLSGFGPTVLGEVSAISLILVGLAMIGLGFRSFFSSNRSAFEHGAPLQPFALGWWLWPVMLSLWAWLMASSFMPLFSLLVTSLQPAIGVPLTFATMTFDHYRFVLLGDDEIQRAFINSLTLSTAAGFVSVLIVLPLGYFLTIRKSLLARCIDFLADAPYAVPGIVLAIGIILVYLPPLPIMHVTLYGTIWILLIAYLARALPLALRPTVAAFEQLDRAMDEAGQMAGASVVKRLRQLLLPSVAPSLAAGAILVFMIAFTELTVSALLWSSGHETLGVVVFMLQGEGNTTAAAALAVLMILVVSGMAMILNALSRWLPKGVVPWQA